MAVCRKIGSLGWYNGGTVPVIPVQYHRNFKSMVSMVQQWYSSGSVPLRSMVRYRVPIGGTRTPDHTTDSMSRRRGGVVPPTPTPKTPVPLTAHDWGVWMNRDTMPSARLGPASRQPEQSPARLGPRLWELRRPTRKTLALATLWHTTTTNIRPTLNATEESNQDHASSEG